MRILICCCVALMLTSCPERKPGPPGAAATSEASVPTTAPTSKTAVVSERIAAAVVAMFVGEATTQLAAEQKLAAAKQKKGGKTAAERARTLLGLERKLERHRALGPAMRRVTTAELKARLTDKQASCLAKQDWKAANHEKHTRQFLACGVDKKTVISLFTPAVTLLRGSLALNNRCATQCKSAKQARPVKSKGKGKGGPDAKDCLAECHVKVIRKIKSDK